MNSTRLILSLVVAATLCPLTATAQFNTIAQSARSGALGGAFCFDASESSLSLVYRQDFLLASLAAKSIALQWNAGAAGTMVAMYEHNGNIDYHEQQAAAGYVLRVAPWLYVGVAGRYLHLGTSDAYYTPQQWLAASALVQAEVGKSTSLTLLAGTRPWDSDQPYRLHFQVGYRPLPILRTLVELEKEDCLRWRFGMEYCYNGQCFLRMGMATQPTVFTFGVGARLWQRYALDLAIEAHNALGITPHLTLMLCF